ncbi:Compactin diketide synthase mokB [Apiospora marii]|uniref:Compactin diketide synthase mokB n=1 Tax=Apiospora marii TaxID=335849 RepID=A0ABR1S1J9_9PEZI
MDPTAPLAVVGYAYRAPGVGRKGLREFLAEAKSAWSQGAPADRFNHEAFYHPENKSGFHNSQGGHFLPDDIYAFDASFFNIKAEEARSIDPETRLVLECAFEAAESAGLTLPALAGANVGVFAQATFSDYSARLAEDLATANKYAALGLSPALTANRLSYFFGLTGPSLAVDAACAGSTYAIHQACHSLRAGECAAALVVAGERRLGAGDVGFVGGDWVKGKSFAYDSRASGFGRGEGGGCLIIKPLSDAIACGDPVRAIIRSSACNHSGRTQGITMPSQMAQQRLLARLHESVGLDPGDTAFVEGHGTGTKAGDPIDAGAVMNVIANSTAHKDMTYIGSAKSNFGHLEGASGLISVVKAVMMLEKQRMLPNANFEKFNPEIAHNGRLAVLTEPIPWPATRSKKRVCVTNFGFGGSNSAVLLEQYAVQPETNGCTATAADEVSIRTEKLVVPIVNGDSASSEKETDSDSGVSPASAQDQKLFVFSAASSTSLAAYVPSLKDHLALHPTSSSYVMDLAFTLGQRRTHFPRHRMAITANSTITLGDQLLSTPSKSGYTRDPLPVFIFTGQGAQYFRMAAGLDRYPAFSGAIQRAERFLTEQLGAPWSLTAELAKAQAASRIDGAEICQPACTAVQLALVALLQSWGVAPAAVVGHSSGEIAAAYAAKLISFEAAVAVAYFRGIAVQEVIAEGLEQGAMLAVGVGAEEAAKLIDAETEEGGGAGYVTVAAVNSHNSVTLSGDLDVIENIQEKCQERDVFARRLKVEIAYHSRHVESAAESYRLSIQPFCLSSQQSPERESASKSKPAFLSSVTGRQEVADTVDEASYWVRNLVGTVQFVKALEALSEFTGQQDQPVLAIELGPHSALKTPTMQTMETLRARDPQNKRPALTYCPSLLRGTPAIDAMLDLAGKLFVAGYDINLGEVNQTSDAHAKVLTDLPAYEWNKSTRYIHQPRIATQKLLGGEAPHPLLGSRSPYTDGHEVAYRHVFNLDDLPWIRDHNIAGEVLFPLTGFFSLAVEAFRKLDRGGGGAEGAVTVDPTTTVLVREFHIMRSLSIKEDELVDLTIKLRPADMGTEVASATVWAFEVSSWSGATHGWTVHCRGLVEKESGGSGGGGETFLQESPTVRAASELLLQEQKQPASQLLDHEAEYALQRQNGVLYGPTPRHHGRRRRPLPSPITVDPPTLDSCCHAIGVIQELEGPRPVHVPTNTHRWRLSPAMPLDAGRELTVVSRKISHDLKSGNLHLSIVVFDLSNGSPRPVMEIDDMALKTIVQVGDDRLLQGLPRTYFMRVDEAADESSRPPHLAKFLAWARRLLARQPLVEGEEADVEALIKSVSCKSASGEMQCAVGEKLPAIMRGEVEPLEIMLEDGLLTRYYEQDPATKRATLALAGYAALLFDCRPELRILEIGAGTGSATLPVLEAMLGNDNVSGGRVQYTFTDISAGFFENAAAKLRRWSRHVTYQKLDIGKDPLTQGFVAQSYDLVIASNVLHATPDIVTTVKHAGALLRPGGKLALLELTQASIPSVFPFASLPGWWLSEDQYRSVDGPLLTKDSWHALLGEAGFSGVDGYVDDYPGEPEQFATAMWSTRRHVPESSEKAVGCFSICPVSTAGSLNATAAFADKICQELGQLPDVESRVSQIQDNPIATDPKKTTCIFVDDPENSIFRDLSSEQFASLQHALLEAAHVLWVVPVNAHPDAAFATGFLRTLRIEDSAKAFVLLEQATLDGAGVDAIVNLARRLGDPDTLHEQEYCMRDGMVHVPAGVVVKEETKLWGETEKALSMTVDAVGSPDSIFFRDVTSEVFHQPLAGDEIIIQVGAIGVNFRDLLLVLGSLPWHAPGFEGAGVVIKTGPDVQDLQAGDRVFYAIAEGGITNYVRTPSAMAHKLPEHLDPAEAASMPIAYCTALASLVDTARLQRGESVLIHAATGAVGQACIMLAQHLGASEIFATAGTPEKRAFLTDTFGIPPSHIFSSRNAEFHSPILLATNGRGVDVVVNSLSGELLAQSWALTAPHGRFVELGKKDLFQNSHLAMRPFLQNVSFHSLDVRMAERARPGAMRGWLASIADLYRSGAIRPIQPVTRIPIAQMAAGLRKLQSGQNVGKIVLTLGPEATVWAEKRSPLAITAASSSSGRTTLLAPDATYLITGGTGGIGRSLAEWMVKEGARHVVLLGRSGSSSPKVAELLARYEGTDVCMRAIACDVGSRESLDQAREEMKGMPPVRGVVHGALYLRDAMFLNSSFEDYQNITRPKIRAAWSLHEMFPDLDFFISLSSVDAIIGHFGQSMYAGTSVCNIIPLNRFEPPVLTRDHSQTFLDAFSEHRLRRGQPAVSISLPVVEGVGYVADRGIADRLKGSLGLSLDEAQLHTLVRAAVLGPSSHLNVQGRSFSFVATPTPEALPWEHFHPLRAMRLRGGEEGADGQNSQGQMMVAGGAMGANGGGGRMRRPRL